MQYLEILIWLDKLKQANPGNKILLEQFNTLDEALSKIDDAENTFLEITSFLEVIAKSRINYPRILSAELTLNQLKSQEGMDTFKNTFDVAGRQFFQWFIHEDFKAIEDAIGQNLDTGKQNKAKMEQNVQWLLLLKSSTCKRDNLLMVSSYWLSLLQPTVVNIKETLGYFLLQQNIENKNNQKNAFALFDLIAKNSPNFSLDETIAFHEPLEKISKEYILETVKAGGNSEYAPITKFDKLNLIKNLLDASSPLGARMEQQASSDDFLSRFKNYREEVETLFLNEPKMDKIQLGEFYLSLYTRDLIQNASAPNEKNIENIAFYREKAKRFLGKKPFHYAAAKALYEANSPTGLVNDAMFDHAEKYSGADYKHKTVRSKLPPEQYDLLGKISVRCSKREFALSLFFASSVTFKFERRELAAVLEADYQALPEKKQKDFRTWIRQNVTYYEENLVLMPSIYAPLTAEVKEAKALEEEKRQAKEQKIAQEKEAEAERERKSEEARFAREEERKRIVFERQLEREKQAAENKLRMEEKERVANEKRLAKEEARVEKTINESWSSYQSAVKSLQMNGLNLDETAKPQNIKEAATLGKKTDIIKQILAAQTQFERLQLVREKVLNADEPIESPLHACNNVDELTQTLLKRLTDMNQMQVLQIQSAARALKSTCSNRFKELNRLESDINQLQKGTRQEDVRITNALKAMERVLAKKVFDPDAFLNGYDILHNLNEGLPQRIADASAQKNELVLAGKVKAEEKERLAQAELQAQLQAEVKNKTDSIWAEFENVVGALREQGYVGALEERPSVDEQDAWKGLEKWIGRINMVILSMKQFHVLEGIYHDLKREDIIDSPLKSCDNLGSIDAKLFQKIKAINENQTKTLLDLAKVLRDSSVKKSNQLQGLQNEVSELEKQVAHLTESDAQPTHQFQKSLSNYSAKDKALVAAIKKNPLDATFSTCYNALEAIDKQLATQIKHAEEIKGTLTQEIDEKVTNLSEEEKQLSTTCSTYIEQFKAGVKRLEVLGKTISIQAGNHGEVPRASLVEGIKTLQTPLSDLINTFARENKQLRFSPVNQNLNKIRAMRNLNAQCEVFAKNNPLEVKLSRLEEQVKQYIEARESYQNEAKSIGEALFNALNTAKQSVEKDKLKNDKMLSTQVEKLLITTQLIERPLILSFFTPNPWDEVLTKQQVLDRFNALASSDNPLNLQDIKREVEAVASALQQKITQQQHVESKQFEAIQNPALIQTQEEVPEIKSDEPSIVSKKPKEPKVIVADVEIKSPKVRQPSIVAPQKKKEEVVVPKVFTMPPETVEAQTQSVAANDPSMPKVEAKPKGFLDWLIPDFILRFMDKNPKDTEEVLPEQLPSVQPVLPTQSKPTVYVPEDYAVSVSELGYSSKKPSLWSQLVTWFNGLFAKEEEQLPQEKPKEASLPQQDVTPRHYSPPRQSNYKQVKNDMITGKGRAQLDEDTNDNVHRPK